MACVIPPVLKIVTAVIRRAEELEKDPNKDAQIVAYYCRLYAVTKGSKICGTDPEAGKFLMSQMEHLERVKPGLNITKDQGHETCIRFAANAFNKADEQDRLGLADKVTAKIYYSAGTFFDILEQFGDIDQETQEKRKYAKWKATDIVNSIKLGQKPSIGGYGEEIPDVSGSDEPTVSGAYAPIAPVPFEIPAAPVGATVVVDIPKAPFSISPTPVQQLHSQHQQNSTAFVPPPPVNTNHFSPAPISHGPANNGYSRPGYISPSVPIGSPVVNTDPRVKDSIELCSFAIAALKHNEISLARDRLTEALRRLG